MGTMFDALKHVESPAAPVVLPMRREERSQVEVQGELLKPEKATHARPAQVKRFEFPELPDRSPAYQAPLALWPENDNRAAARAYAEIADAMLRQLPLQQSTVVGLTSPCDGDGKTSAVIGLAPQLAKRIAGNVLAVDANARKPSLTAQVNIATDKELGRTLVIYPTNIQRLSILPMPLCWGDRCKAALKTSRTPLLQKVGPQPRSFDESGIEELRETWPLVLLDMASLEYPEVSRMAQRCDGVYLVVRVGHTPRSAVAEAARVIRGAGVRLFGSVVIE